MQRVTSRRELGVWIILASCGLSPVAYGEGRRPLPGFDRIMIDNDFPGAYQVEVADVNGDGKPDVIAVGGGTCAWYENPSWNKRIVSGPDRTPGIITSATADLDGDGKAEVAIGYEFEMNDPTKGKLALAIQGSTPEEAWTVRQVADVPSIHRLRWAPIGQPDRLDLVVAPIFGRTARPPTFAQAPATLQVFQTGDDPRAGAWSRQSATGDFVIHAIAVRRPGHEEDPLILTASAAGVREVVLATDPQGHRGFSAFNLFSTPPGEPPNRGCSEIHLGRLADGRPFLATIEPWHGSRVAVRLRTAAEDRPGNRDLFGPLTVLDDTLDAGHALWVADVDGDGDDEVFAGHRGEGHRVSAYDFDGHRWNRTVLDLDIAAQDLRGGDLDGNGTPDVVAVGGETHNVVWYRPKRSE